jgi:hypothetical protein
MPLGCPLPDAVSGALRPGDATHPVMFRPRGFTPPRRLAPSGGRGSVAPRYRSEVRCVSGDVEPGAVRRPHLSRTGHPRNAASYPSKDPTRPQPYRVTAACALLPLLDAPCSAAPATGDDSGRAPPGGGPTPSSKSRGMQSSQPCVHTRFKPESSSRRYPTSHQHAVSPPRERQVPEHSPSRCGDVPAAPGARASDATRATERPAESAPARVSGVRQPSRPAPTRREPPKRVAVRAVPSTRGQRPTRTRRAEVDGVQGAAVRCGDAPVHRGEPPRRHDIETNRPKAISRCFVARPAHRRSDGTSGRNPGASKRLTRVEDHLRHRHIELESYRDCGVESLDVPGSSTEVPLRHAEIPPPRGGASAGPRIDQPLGWPFWWSARCQDPSPSRGHRAGRAGFKALLRRRVRSVPRTVSSPGTPYPSMGLFPLQGPPPTGAAVARTRAATTWATTRAGDTNVSGKSSLAGCHRDHPSLGSPLRRVATRPKSRRRLGSLSGR